MPEREPVHAPLLRVDGLTAGYGAIDIVKDVALEAQAGEIVTIIGPNGAGKSTLIKAIAGVVKARRGQVVIDGVDVRGQRASEVARAGLAYVPQEANVFRNLSVQENLRMGAWLAPAEQKRHEERVFALFPVLAEKRGTRAGLLSGGQRQMVAFAMALMVDPKVLLLDEPSAGLSPLMVAQMFEAVKRVNTENLCVLMVEQNARQALQMSARGYVMVAGQIAHHGLAADLLSDAHVGKLYLGAA